MSSKNIYYVYAYIRANNSKIAKAGTPYYIGKGSGQRAFYNHGKISIPKDRTKIIFLEMHLSEVGIFALKRRLIELVGL